MWKLKAVTLKLVLAMLFTGLAAQAGAAEWKVDPARTHVGFSVRNFFTRVQGHFNEFAATIRFDPDDPQKTVVMGTVWAKSIHTDNPKRDKHLRSPDYFDIDVYPTLEFTSSAMQEWSNRKGKLAGMLSIHGIARAVVFDVVFLGQNSDSRNNVRAQFRATLTIDREDFGLIGNTALETGGILVGSEVEIRIDAEGVLTE